mmetsp:Transcript_68/g.152  ORF Transcript_68/g.152 Transcript_68/m.152 type:complete len:133 (-) Transcript_68:14-412(-)
MQKQEPQVEHNHPPKIQLTTGAAGDLVPLGRRHGKNSPASNHNTSSQGSQPNRKLLTNLVPVSLSVSGKVVYTPFGWPTGLTSHQALAGEIDTSTCLEGDISNRLSYRFSSFLPCVILRPQIRVFHNAFSFL